VIGHSFRSTDFLLDPQWPLDPGTEGKTWTPGFRGVREQAWHVYVATSCPAIVVAGLANWLNSDTPRRDTPRRDLPYSARTQFVYDWRTVKSGRLEHVRQSKRLKNTIVNLIGRHNNFATVTCLLGTTFSIHSMLKQQQIPLYGIMANYFR